MPKGPNGGKYIATSEKLWELFTAYAKNVKENPREVSVFGGKDFEEQTNKLERPLTMCGFECYVAENGGPMTLEHYFANSEGAYEDYRTICSRIRKAIRTDQIEGGMVGQYNASITQRLNGLKEQTENTNTNNNVNLLTNDPLSDEGSNPS